MPKVSVVIPTYNQADLLAKALASVRAQTEADWEAIVVNNHSDDHTVAVVEAIGDPRIKRIDFANHGVIAASRNIGIRAATSDWIAFLDSDDLWEPAKLETCLQAIDADTDIVSHREKTARDGAVVSVSPHYSQADAAYRTLLFRRTCFSPTATLVRKACIDAVGGFSERQDFVTCEDYDLWLKLAAAGARVKFVDAVLSTYRLHAGNSSASIDRHLAAGLAVVDDHYARLTPRGALDGLRRRRRRAELRYGAGRVFQRAGAAGEARRYFVDSLKEFPLFWRAPVAFLLTCLPGQGSAPGHEMNPEIAAAPKRSAVAILLLLWVLAIVGAYLAQFRGFIQPILKLLGAA